MKCPRTGKPMEEVEIGGVKVDVSTGCGGVWFDNFEIKKFDEIHESAGDDLIAKMEKYCTEGIDLEQRLKCPRGCDAVLRRFFFNVKRKVEIDECPQCAGVWLDAGELLSIRKTYPNEAEKVKAAEAYLNDIFENDEGVRAIIKESQEGLAKARRFANMFKYICPTYYIPGDQDWGAF